MKKLTTEEFIEKARQIHGWKYTYSKVDYENSKTNVCIICPEHGEFLQKPREHLNGCGCPKCGGTKKLTTDEFIQKGKDIHEDKYDYLKVNYIDAHKKVCIICHRKDKYGNEHGEFWQRPNEHLNGCGCPKCGHDKTNIKQTFTTDDFVQKAREVHRDKYDYSKVNYVNSQTKVCIICPKHGEFWQIPNQHLKGRGCLRCKNSYLENEISKILEDNNIRFDAQKTFEWLKNKKLLRLDFYLPDYNIAIECQGIQHFKPVDCFGGEQSYEKLKKIDKIKYDLCLKHNIKLIYFVKHKKEYYIDNNIYINNIFKNKKELLNLLYESLRNC